MDEIAVIGGEGMNDEKAKMLKITTDQIEQKFGRGSIMKLGEGGEHLNIGVIPTGALPARRSPRNRRRASWPHHRDLRP